MAVSQRDIADRLGVSVALVSRVLSGKAAEIGVAQGTIERVLSVAEELGYVPNAAALSLKGKVTRTIGVVVMEFSDPYFGEMVEQLQVQAHAHGYSLVLTGFRGRTPSMEDLGPFHKHAIEGLIILGSELKAKWLRSFRKIPVARIGHGSADERSVRVVVDEADAARRLVDHLVGRGFCRPVFVGDEQRFVHGMRFKLLAMAAERLGVTMGSLFLSSAGLNRGYVAARQLAERGNVDAVVCATDRIALSVLHGLNEAGIGVPDGVAVTGFDDIPGAEHYIPALTTFRQPMDQMVKRAFEVMMRPAESREIVLSGDVVVRKSS